MTELVGAKDSIERFCWWNGGAQLPPQILIHVFYDLKSHVNRTNEIRMERINTRPSKFFDDDDHLLWLSYLKVEPEDPLYSKTLLYQTDRLKKIMTKLNNKTLWKVHCGNFESRTCWRLLFLVVGTTTTTITMPY